MERGKKHLDLGGGLGGGARVLLVRKEEGSSKKFPDKLKAIGGVPKWRKKGSQTFIPTGKHVVQLNKTVWRWVVRSLEDNPKDLSRQVT